MDGKEEMLSTGNQEVIELKLVKQPSSSNSDISDSDWAVIDEDTTLEWNTEMQYHFRQTVSKSNELLNLEASDEDSIELIDEESFRPRVGDDLLVMGSTDSESQSCTELQCDTCTSEVIPPRKVNPTEVNPLDHWDMIAILMVALIGGIALGYFWGTFTGLQKTHEQTFRLIESRLEFDNKLLRHRIRRLSSSLSHQVPPVEEALLRDLNKLCLTSRNEQTEMDQASIGRNPSATLKHSLDQMYNVTRPLDVMKWNETETALASSTKLLQNIGRNLEMLRAKNVAPKLQADIASLSLRAEKTSRKMYDKMHRSIQAQAKKNLHRLNELSSKMMKKLCSLKEIIDLEESLDQVLIEELLGGCKKNEVKKEKIKLDPDCVKKNSSEVPASGEWILRMGKAREYQRQNDHQSDWLFERSRARESQRSTDKERGDNIFKRGKRWLRESIRSTRSAFDQVRKKVKQRNR